MIKSKKRILFFSFNYYPDQSAGAKRAYELAKNILNFDENIELKIITSKPKRFSKKHNYKYKKFHEKVKIGKNKSFTILRLWIPEYSTNPISQTFSYLFYFIQSIICSLLFKPNIIISTSAKLLTAFAASLSAKLVNAKLYTDIRDTFVDNYFYFYRYKKKIIIHPLLLMLENIVFKWSNKINFVSLGFKNTYFGLDKFVNEECEKITYFTQGISNRRLKEIKSLNYLETKNKNKTILYAGNIGEGQDIYSLIIDIKENKITQELMKELDLNLIIFGAGSQAQKLKELIERFKNTPENEDLSKRIKFNGLVNRKDIIKYFEIADCLLIHLAKYFSLTNVIPTKLFEYVSTPLPILHGSSGFTKDFINKVNGTINFEPGNSLGLIKSYIKSQKIKINLKKRQVFLDQYNSQRIYKNYVNYLLKD